MVGINSFYSPRIIEQPKEENFVPHWMLISPYSSLPKEPPPPYSERPPSLRKHSYKRIDGQCLPDGAQRACPACCFRFVRSGLKKRHSEQKKPYTAITVQVDHLTSEQYDENDIGGLVDLIEVIRLQDSGPTEAARALRKKLKYGNMHRQLRSLTILDGLIQNAGARFQRTFADEALLERLRVMARGDMVDADVKEKCNLLFRQWALAYKGKPGLEKIAQLYKQLPQTRRPQPHQSKVVRETEADVHNEPTSPTSPSHSRTSSSVTAPFSSSPSTSRTVAIGAVPPPSSSIFKRDKKSKNKDRGAFNLEKEKPQMMETIAQASIASTNLLNGLQLINREVERVSENPEVVKRFENCKSLRRQVLRYIQHVESEQWIGSLLTANDDLVKALMAYEIMDKSIDDDSDSDAERYIKLAANAQGNTSDQHDIDHGLSGLKIEEAAPPKPPRPGQILLPPQVPYSAPGKQKAEDSEPEEDDDEDNPFADTNAVKTPHLEKAGMTWRDV